MDKGATLVTAALPSAFFFEVIDEIWSKAISSLTTHTRTPLCGREPLSGTHTTHTHTHTQRLSKFVHPHLFVSLAGDILARDGLAQSDFRYHCC